MAEIIEYKQDYAGMGEILRSAEVAEMLMARAEQVGVPTAQSHAPVATGHYRDSIHAVDLGVGGDHHDRREVNIVADASYSVELEWGSRHNRAMHVLAGSIDAIERA